MAIRIYRDDIESDLFKVSHVFADTNEKMPEIPDEWTKLEPGDSVVLQFLNPLAERLQQSRLTDSGPHYAKADAGKI